MVNGHPSLLGADGRPVRSGRRPIVGLTKARITRPLLVPPTMRGRHGRAWECDLNRIRAKTASVQSDAMLCHWIVEAPWSHEVIHSYSLVMIHLRFDEGRPVQRYLPGATHELHIFAINPQAPRDVMLRSAIDGGKWLHPPVFAAQMAEGSDEAALTRVKRSVSLVVDGKVSPHIDHVASWVEQYGDNMLFATAAAVQS